MKTKYFIIVLILGLQFCFSQEPVSDSLAYNNANAKLELAEKNRANLEREKALQKAEREREKQLEKAEKARKKLKKN